MAAVIHHGIDLDVHKPGPGTGGYLLFVGRMSAGKGAHHAVRVARRAGWPLVIAARIGEPAERAYFEKQVRPLLGPDYEMLAEQPLAARVDLMGHAAALVNPITWPEPFGLVMAEALATATPALAFPHGAAPEIIDHGRTGYLTAGARADRDRRTVTVPADPGHHRNDVHPERTGGAVPAPARRSGRMAPSASGRSGRNGWDRAGVLRKARRQARS